MSSKRNYKRKSLKKGGAGAAEHAIAVYGNINEQHAQPGSNVIEAKVVGGERESEVSGGNILTDIAVPAILITTRELYKGRTRKSKGKRLSRKSRRQSRRR